jgi:anti-anti-sigma factor
VTVSDSGSWRPPPADPGFRGRGLQLLRELTAGVEVDGGATGTVVRFVLPLPMPQRAPGPAREGAREGVAAAVAVARRNGVVHLELSGDLDLAGVEAIRDELLTAVGGGEEPLRLDVRGLTALSSSGLGLLMEAARLREGGPPLDVLLPTTGPVRRLLDMTGLVAALTAGGDPTGSRPSDRGS